jgi:enoyl-CoA hydratase
MSYECILTEVRGEGARKTGLITLNRPKQLNALNGQLMDELGAALLAFDADEGIGCIVITGSEKAFAAGADIAAMATLGYMEAYTGGFITRNWETIRQVRKPVIAAVAGFALRRQRAGDDVRHHPGRRHRQVRPARDQAGHHPRAGGTQRLPRAVGKAKAMELLLTGRMMGAEEAERAGLVARVVPAASLLDEALAVAAQINELSGPSLMMIKECVNEAFESGLSTGVRTERHMFQSLFGTEDQREGMAAFLEKRKPAFRHR